TCKLSDGDFQHARLPRALEGIDAELRLTNVPMSVSTGYGVLGDLRITEAKLKAHAGRTLVSASLKDLRYPFCTLGPDGTGCIDDCVAELGWNVEHLDVTDELFTKLPPALAEIRDEYWPKGPASVSHRFQRTAGGGWTKTYEIKPE